MKYNFILFLTFILHTIGGFYNDVRAQSLEHKEELWLGYMTTSKVFEKHFWWNDFHFVPNSFVAIRTGWMFAFSPNLDFVAGYAWVATNTSFSDKLIRNENRLWTQIEYRQSLNNRFSVRNRFRYDARFRNAIKQDEVLNEYVFVNRYRWMSSVRFVFAQKQNKRYHFNIMNEVLINSGAEIQGLKLDQNRFYALLGMSKANFTVLAGYDWRVFPVSNQNQLMRHGFTLWIIQRFGVGNSEKIDNDG